MIKLQVSDDRSASGCTTCKSSCSVNKLLPNFPASTQRKLDSLVVSINEYNSSCEGKSRIDDGMVSGFRAIMARVGAVIEEDGRSMPELEGALMALIEREAGPQFKFLLEKVMG
jgi:hypothetical protein